MAVWERWSTAARSETPENNPAAQAIRDLCGRLRAVDSRFSEETDTDLLESCMYERLALQAQYRYLRRQVQQTAVRESGG